MLLVVEQIFGVSVVVLNEEILVLVVKQAIIYFYCEIEVEIPAFSLGRDQSKSPTVVG